MKLHTMNLIAAGSPLIKDMEFVCVFCSHFPRLFLPFLPGAKKIPWDFGQFRDARGTGLGLTEDQCYMGPLDVVVNHNKDR